MNLIKEDKSWNWTPQGLGGGGGYKNPSEIYLNTPEESWASEQIITMITYGVTRA